MTLKDLEAFDPVTIQCHDNPDADALGAGFGLYAYFKSLGRQTRLIYSGRNPIQKSNLKIMIDELHIPVEYVRPDEEQPLFIKGLLVTVDCQYGAGNVTKIAADTVAIVDHHQVEIDGVPLSLIVPALGSCCTLVWKLLRDEKFDIKTEPGLETALYYGLYTDTNQLSEIRNPLDMDMRDDLAFDAGLINYFKNSNLSLKELEIAGVALIRYSFNEDYNFAVIKAQPCDPNILGLISDFLLQVDVITSCLVFNENADGYKFSVRSCIREVNASELASYLCEGIGSGGGHYEKAGGFVSKKLYEKHYPTLHPEVRVKIPELPGRSVHIQLQLAAVADRIGTGPIPERGLARRVFRGAHMQENQILIDDRIVAALLGGQITPVGQPDGGAAGSPQHQRRDRTEKKQTFFHGILLSFHTVRSRY